MYILRKIALFFFDILDLYFHQKRILKFFKKNIHKIDFFIDVGAHNGTYTDLFIQHYKIKKVLMFEPQKKIFNFIKNKYKKKKNIECLNLAISNNNNYKVLKLNLHDLTSTFSSFSKNNYYLTFKAMLFGVKKKKMIYGIEKVKTVTLSKIFVKNYKNTNIDLVKIDTEGHEFEVLKGTGEKMKSIKCIIIEFHLDNIFKKYNPNNIHKYLLKKNFVLSKIIRFPFTTWEDRIYLNQNFFK